MSSDPKFQLIHLETTCFLEFLMYFSTQGKNFAPKTWIALKEINTDRIQ